VQRQLADLITRRAGELPLHKPELRADAAAARMRLMHTVYLSAHAVTSALQQHGRRLHHDTRHQPRQLQLGKPGLPYAVGPTSRWVQRLGVCESIAGRYVRSADGGFAAAVTGETRPPLDEPDRLQRHLARWDVQVHRTLAADPSSHSLVLASRTQAFIAATALTVLEAAAHADIFTGSTDVARLQRAVASSGEAWNQLASRWADLAPANTRADPNLTHAADQLRAAGRELTHTSRGKATPEDIRDRVDLTRLVESLGHAAAAAVDIAHLARELADNPDLTGPARPLSIRAHNETELINRSAKGAAERDVVWIRPMDVLANKLVPVPRPVADGLIGVSSRVLKESGRAAATLGIEVDHLEAPTPLAPHPRTRPRIHEHRAIGPKAPQPHTR